MPTTNPAPAAQTPETTEPTKKRGARRWITPVLGLVAAIAIGLFGGILIGHNGSSTSQTAAGRGFSGGAEGGFPGGAEGGGTGAGGGLTAGTVQSVDGDTITLKLTDGSTVKVTTTSDTAVTKTEDGTVSDLAKGDTVAVRGTTGSDGTVAATTVTEGALTGGFGGGTPPTGSGSNE
ncbi:MAG TPA: DUF5666 domain-containing protein [Lacisediminihabitans sp.]|uniref:DUF5666 domain-containing protein n=1 Tax=Lacisediminihabitans sp. TaxID=2787631 RepID=UPI002ED7A247